MTIKKRLFMSNILMSAVPVAAWVSFFTIFWIIFFILTKTTGVAFPTREVDQRWLDKAPFVRMLFIGMLVLLAAVIYAASRFLTHHIVKDIAASLDTLTAGVRQIHDSNLSYRIDYQVEDEFRPICEAFNGMAQKLEESAAQQKKDEANRRELIAGISHDLRTPLTSIKGYLEGIETGVASTLDMQKKYFATIKNKTADLEHIIEQLFLFSKLDMDEFPLTLHRIDIGRAVTDMIQEAETEYAPRGLTVRLAEVQSGLSAAADVLWLRNVIVNILENSAKYKTRPQGTMTVACAAGEDAALGACAILRLADDGPGVSPEALGKLFDVFYRADPARSKKGSGLGLAIGARIIRRMGGRIHAELPAAGGLAIVVSLPLLQGEG
ncbi:MAG: HAMP domain-containing histidine kinase [Spirochaetaceae bacterium]|jgi:signal transduction histidine kinase|nr:HAMP domain-containing histidine kinase [Spirochaetaceae bacterium]